jgi:ATP-dependent helicase YprA (DUF1998 family)
MDSLRSTLYALLESVPALDIPQEDVDGAVRYSTTGRASLVIFDAVPGGAGHAKRLASRLPDLARAALERVETCECGEETSCYSCLRSYRNQIWHDDLRRGDALRLIGSLVP